MALIYPSPGRVWVVDSRSHGQLGILGNSRDESSAGAWMVQIVPDATFIGSFVVLGRISGISTADQTVPFDPIPFRLLNRDNICGSGDLISDTASLVLTSKALIQIPANQMSVGIMVACTDGFATIYSRVMDGAAFL